MEAKSGEFLHEAKHIILNSKPFFNRKCVKDLKELITGQPVPDPEEFELLYELIFPYIENIHLNNENNICELIQNIWKTRDLEENIIEYFVQKANNYMNPVTYYIVTKSMISYIQNIKRCHKKRREAVPNLGEMNSLLETIISKGNLLDGAYVGPKAWKLASLIASLALSFKVDIPLLALDPNYAGNIMILVALKQHELIHKHLKQLLEESSAEGGILKIQWYSKYIRTINTQEFKDVILVHLEFLMKRDIKAVYVTQNIIKNMTITYDLESALTMFKLLTIPEYITSPHYFSIIKELLECIFSHIQSFPIFLEVANSLQVLYNTYKAHVDQRILILELYSKFITNISKREEGKELSIETLSFVLKEVMSIRDDKISVRIIQLLRRCIEELNLESIWSLVTKEVKGYKVKGPKSTVSNSVQYLLYIMGKKDPQNLQASINPVHLQQLLLTYSPSSKIQYIHWLSTIAILSLFENDELILNKEVLNFLCTQNSHINSMTYYRRVDKDKAVQMEVATSLQLNIIKQVIIRGLDILTPTQLNYLVNSIFQISVYIPSNHTQALNTIEDIIKGMNSPQSKIYFLEYMTNAVLGFVLYNKDSKDERKGELRYKISKILILLMSEGGKLIESDPFKLSSIYLMLIWMMHSPPVSSTAHKFYNSLPFQWIKLKKELGMNVEWLCKNYMGDMMQLIVGREGLLNNEADLVNTSIRMGRTIISVRDKSTYIQLLTQIDQILDRKLLFRVSRLESVLEGDLPTMSVFEAKYLYEVIKDVEALGLSTHQKLHSFEKALNNLGEIEEEKEDKLCKGGKGQGKKGKKGNQRKALGGKEDIGDIKLGIVRYVEKAKEDVRYIYNNILKLVEECIKEGDHGDHGDHIFDYLLSSSVFQKLISNLKYPQVRFQTLITLQHILNLPIPQNRIRSLADKLPNMLLIISTNSILSKVHQDMLSKLLSQIKELKLSQLGYGQILLILRIVEFTITNSKVPTKLKNISIDITQELYEHNPKTPFNQLCEIGKYLLLSTYKGNNLKVYIMSILQASHKYQIYTLFKSFLNYEFEQKILFLQSINLLKTGIAASETWLTSCIWLCLFEENEQLSKLAIKVWNKFCLTLDSQLLQEGGILQICKSRVRDVADLGKKASIIYLESYPQIYKNILPVLLSGVEDSIAYILGCTGHLVSQHNLHTVFEFLILKGAIQQDNEISNKFIDCGLQIVYKIGNANTDILLQILEKYLQIEELGDDSKNVCAIYLGALARFLSIENTNLRSIFSTLVELLPNSSYYVQVSIAQSLPYFSKLYPKEAGIYLDESLEEILSQRADEYEVQAHAFIVAGLVKGLGVKLVKEKNLMGVLSERFTDKGKSSELRKENSLISYMALSEILGRSYEVYGLECISNILQCFGDNKESVRYWAQEASRTFMSKLSRQGVKRVLPILIHGVKDENWRSKLASVDALGTMAYLGPKQLSSYLPKIVTNIKEILNDTHPKVHHAGLQALASIGSAIKNPEISDISGGLIQGLRDPNTHLLNALNLLLRERFSHAIDTASLSLIIPIIETGLTLPDNKTKKKASQLVGNICSVVQNKEDLLPYLHIIIPALKASLGDPIPEVRASAAKAIGSLTQGLGIENSTEIITWVKYVLQHHGSLVERSGAAQAYAEIIGTQGKLYFEQELQEIIDYTSHEESYIREGYIGLFVFLPTSFTEHFEKYFNLCLPLVLDGLSDITEEVRSSAKRVVQICIKIYGKTKTHSLLEPLLKKVYANNWRLRESALFLISELLLLLEQDLLKREPVYVSIEEKDDILTALFIMKTDENEGIRDLASKSWKAIVDNQPKVLKVIMDTLLNKIFILISREKGEIVEVACDTIRELAGKFGDRFLKTLFEFFGIKMEEYGEDDGIYTVAICTAVLEICDCIPRYQLNPYRMKVLEIVKGLITSDEPQIQKSLANIFSQLIEKDIQNTMIQIIVNLYDVKLVELSKAEDLGKITLILESTSFLLSEYSKATEEFIFVWGKEPLNSYKIDGIKSIVPFFVEHLFDNIRYRRLIDQCFSKQLEENVDPQLKQATLDCLKEICIHIGENEMSKFVELLLVMIDAHENAYNQRLLFCRMVTHLFTQCEYSLEEYAQAIFPKLLEIMGEKEEKIGAEFYKAVNAIINVVGKERHYELLSLLKTQIEYLALNSGTGTYKISSIEILNNKGSLDGFLQICLNTLLHSDLNMREASAVTYRYLIDLTSKAYLEPYVKKITGSLIRVATDKFPNSLKSRILESLLSLQRRESTGIKVFLPALQTTLIKSINDIQADQEVTNLSLQNLIGVLKSNKKYDAVIRDLQNYIVRAGQQTKLKGKPLEGIAEIMHHYGEEVSGGVKAGCLNMLMDEIIDGKLEELGNWGMGAAAFAAANIAKGMNLEDYLKLIGRIPKMGEVGGYMRIALCVMCEGDMLSTVHPLIYDDLVESMSCNKDPMSTLQLLTSIIYFIRKYQSPIQDKQLLTFYTSLLGDNSVLMHVMNNTKDILMNILEQLPMPLTLIGTQQYMKFIAALSLSVLRLTRIIFSSDKSRLKHIVTHNLFGEGQGGIAMLSGLKEKAIIDSDSYHAILAIIHD